MTEQLQQLFQEYVKVLDKQVFHPKDLDYRILDYHIPLLESIDVVDSGCISVFDLYQRKHVYYSPKYATVLGWDAKRAESDIHYTNSLVHPDDLPALIQSRDLLFKHGIFFA